jgi:trans-AT polyketide synthase/acyltransferase/oxidoreductase domain-containing protein
MDVLSMAANLSWRGDVGALLRGQQGIAQGLSSLSEAYFVLRQGDEMALAPVGQGDLGSESGDWTFQGFLPALTPSGLGDPAFKKAHGVKYAYVVGAMANGITSVELVEAASAAGGLGIFGAAGLPLPVVEKALDRLQQSLGDKPYGSNLIHSPNEPDLEEGIVDLYLRKGMRRASASAYLGLTLPLLKFRFSGICRRENGEIHVPQQVLGKVSRVEVAEKLLSPPPDKMLRELVERGDLTAQQAEWAALMPVAEDLTAEADSGGHTDNRPALSLVPTMIALRDEKQRLYGDRVTLRVGAAGGISTPASACAAFAMGASYILTGSVNQSCVESGSSDIVREMLCKAGQADVAMAPAADMFEMGVQVQVLKWGTMFPVRAKKLYQLYRDYGSLEELPAAERSVLEKSFFRQTLEEVWADTHKFFQTRDPRQNERASADPKHKMALVFRSYLGRASGWANAGIADRKVDYQVWCGPAMGAFNQWVGDTFLAEPKARNAGLVARNILAGAAYLSRVHVLRQQGVPMTLEMQEFRPKTEAELAPYFA